MATHERGARSPGRNHEVPTPEYPGLFSKFPSSLVGHGDDIVIPSDSDNLHYEGELVVVIGKKAKNVSVTDAPKYLFGVTIEGIGILRNKLTAAK